MGFQGSSPSLDGDLKRTAGPSRPWPLLSYLLLGIAVGATIAAGGLWLASRPNPPPIEILLPTPTPAAPVVAHVVGEVRDPGLYTLPHGSRVEDAIRAAGGASEDGDANGVNRAAPVRDGDQIVVPRREAAAITSDQRDGSGRTLNDALPSREGDAPIQPFSTIAAVATQQAGAEAAPIDLNGADISALMSLPGIGQVRAEAIIRWREVNGPIQSVEDLRNISGIGPGTVSAIRPLVRPQ